MREPEPSSPLRDVIDVVVLTWNDAALADRAVASVAGSRGVDVDLYVVDNGSDPPYRAPIEELTLVRLPDNRGVAGGRNVGASRASAALLCFLDSDAELAPDALRALATAMDDPEVGMAAPVFEGQPPEASAGRRPTLGRKLVRGLGLTSRYSAAAASETTVRRVEFAIGACQLIRRSAFEGVGGLDARYFFGPEDIDFCDRLRSAGWQILQVESAVVRHEARRSHRSLLTLRGLRHALALVWFYMRSGPR